MPKVLRMGVLEDVSYTTSKGKVKTISMLRSGRKLKITNNTSFPIYCAIYFQKQNRVKPIFYRMNAAVIVVPTATIKLKKPSYHCVRTSKGKVFFSTESNNLPEYLFGTITERISSHTVYLSRHLHLCCDRGLLKAYSPFHFAHKESIDRTRSTFVHSKNQLSQMISSSDLSRLLEINNTRSVPSIVRTNFPQAHQLDGFRRISSTLITVPGRPYRPEPIELGDDEDSALYKRSLKTKKGICRFLNEPDNFLDNKKYPKNIYLL